MKFQCPCGAKFAFDITPEMVQNPVKFVCPTCGLDHSEFINGLIRREFSAPEPAYQRPVSEPAPAPAAAAPRLRISHAEKPTEAPVAAAPVSKFCARHRQELVKEKCVVCGTPICSRCMESFGYFCSPLCKNKAEMQGIEAPVYAGQKFEVERQFWAKSGKIFGVCLTVVILFFGAWAWYTFYGSWPHAYLSVRFEDNDRAYSGKSVLVDKDQIVFLHGGTLARYDLKSKKPVWSVELITKADIDAAVKAASEINDKANSGGGFSARQTADVIERETKIELQQELQLHISGQNVWVEKGDKLTQYDWATGNVGHSIQLPEFGGELIETGGELQSIGSESVTHVSLTDGSTHVESFSGTPAARAGHGPGGSSLATDNGQALDPGKIANEAGNMKLQGQIALPALIANAQHEKDLEAAMRETDPQKRAELLKRLPMETAELVAGETGYVQFSKKLLEEKKVEHEAMKAAPKKSALEDNPSVANTGAIVNEQLNEMRRNNGDDKTVEDLSRYQVVVHLPDGSAPDFSAEVTGPPQLFVLKTVNVIAAGKDLIILDKSNKKLWSADLTYAVDAGGDRMFPGEKPRYGDGPCVEHGDSLYVFDQAVLTAFDLASGNARWRVPSVGVVGLFFDDKDNIYVNTTSGNPDDIKYAKQIDVTKQTDDILLKLAPKDGKQLWSIKPGGFISHLQGKYIYIMESFDPNPTDEDQGDNNIIGMMKPASLRITRINPSNGHVMWDIHQDRCPVDIHFDNNLIELVFKREVEVMKFLSF